MDGKTEEDGLLSRRGVTVEYEGDVVKLNSSADVVHIPIEGTTACGTYDISEREYATFTDASNAKGLVLICMDCLKAYDSESGLSTPILRTRIKEALGVDSHDNTRFGQAELRELYQRIVVDTDD